MGSPPVHHFWRVPFALLVLAVVRGLYERTLLPIYAFTPTNCYLDYFFSLSIFFGTYISYKTPVWTRLLGSSLLLAIAPWETYWVAVHSARLHRPILGTSITHLLVLSPLGCILANSILDPPTLQRLPSLRRSLLLCAIAYPSLPRIAAPLLSHLVPYVSHPDTNIWHLLATLLYLLTCLQTSLQTPPPRRKEKKKKPEPHSSSPLLGKIFMIFPIVLAWPIHLLFSSPILPHPLVEPYRQPDSPLLVHSAVESVTGLILVGEILRTSSDQGLDNTMHSVRFLRADHSLLGGVWTGMKVMTLDGEPPLKDTFRNPLGDSIYATFHLQEAVRLVQGKDMKHGVIIGLGTGISASAFMRHNISIDIVEIDPAVYEAARTHFGLADPGAEKVHLEDARHWLSKHIARPQHELFDFVIHDCFSGGGVPEHIYTAEFWEEVKVSLHPHGLVVVNYAGFFLSDSSRMIFHTLMNSFKQCRGFHDQFAPELDPSQYDSDFINIVWICSSSAEPLSFRPSGPADYLGSPLRRHALHDLPKREVPAELLYTDEGNSRFIITDKDNRLGKLQKAQGPHHWEVMREVLPDDIWEIF